MSDDKYKLKADGQDIEVGTGVNLTVLCHPGEMNLESADERLDEITPERTVAFAKTLTEGDWKHLTSGDIMKTLFGCVWGEFPLPATIEDLHKSNIAVRHTVGLIILCVEAVFNGRVPFVRLPETYLHPKQQAGLGDLFNVMTRIGGDKVPT